MSNKKYFPIDVKAVKKYGLKEWRKEFFWPVSSEKLNQMETEIKQVLNELIEENADNYKSDLLLINYKLFFEYKNYMEILLLKNKVEKLGLTPFYIDENIYCKSIIEKGIPSILLIPFPSVRIRKSWHAVRNLKSRLRLMKYTCIFNKSIKSILRSTLQKSPFVTNLSLMNPLAKEYIISKLNDGITLKEIEDWFPKSFNSKLDEAQERELHCLCKTLLNGIDKVAIRLDVKLTRLQITYLHELTMGHLYTTMVLLNALERTVSKQKPIKIIVGTSSKYFVRLLSTVVRKHGGTVSGFMHGQPMHYVDPYLSWVELSTADRFFTYTNNLAAALKKVTQKYPSLRNNPVDISGVETKIFYNLTKENSRIPVPSKIRRVMLVGRAFLGEKSLAQKEACSPVVQLDFELRIVDTLRKGGYDIIYQKHPEGVLRGQTFTFFEDDVKISYEPFESVLDTADAFIFYRTNSSALGPALCTNKPIVCIDGFWENWLPEMHDLFAKRCHIVSAHFDERNRLIINEEELLNALAHKPAEPNKEFIEKYMFPEGLKV